MRVDVIMPKMGESINEGTIIKWHKQKGDKVDKDEIIFEISTDKVDTEIPSPEEGVLVDIKVFEQETVEVDSVVAVIETESNGEVAADVSQENEEVEIPSTTQVGGELIEIPMPKMGESVMDGTIIKWHKKVGDKIERDEILFEISTDKVDTEVPSPVDGTVAEILFKENETVDVETIIARISTSGGLVVPKPTKKSEDGISEEQIQSKTEAIKTESLSTQKIDTGKSNRFYSPLVLNIAGKENVALEELEIISGSGVNGRVTKKDILTYISNRQSGKKELSEIPTAPKQFDVKTDEVKGEGTEIIPMDNIRQRIREHMIKSRDTSVHVSAMIEVDMTKIHNFIESNKDRFLKEEKLKLTYMPFVSYACIRALKKFPFMNASLDENNIVVKKYINLGIAVAVEPNGLIVPNIKGADEKSIKGLAKEIFNLSIKARNKGLVPDDIMDGTFSITNYGVFGTLFGTPIINQPEVAILGIGAVVKKPVVVEVDGTDSIAIKPMMYLSLSHDHRLVDGMLGGQFLKFMKDSLQNFDTSVV